MMSGGPRDGRGSFLLAAGVSSARRRTGMQGSLGEKIGEGAFSEAYALGARASREAVQGRRLSSARPARGTHDPRRARRWRPGAGGVRRGDAGRALRHRDAAPRRTDPVASLANRRGDVRTGGRDRRGSCHVRSQDAPAAGGPFHARLYGGRVSGSTTASFRSTSPPISSP